MSLFVISDGLNNGKGPPLLPLLKFPYKHMFCYENIESYSDFKTIKVVLFNFNEDMFTYRLKWNKHLSKKYATEKQFIDRLKHLSSFFKKNYPNIIIYNDPIKCCDLKSKLLTNTTVSTINQDVVYIPKTKEIRCFDDTKSINFFPLILKTDGESNGSNKSRDVLCKNISELQSNYKKHFSGKSGTIVVEFMNSYSSEYDTNIAVRFVVYNNRVMDLMIRFNKHWNVHTTDSCGSRIQECTMLYQNEINKIDISEFVNEVHSIYGNGFFSIDCTYDPNTYKLGLCEIGLKYTNVDAVWPAILRKYSLQKFYKDTNYFVSNLNNLLFQQI